MSRTAEEWLKEMGEDVRLVNCHVKNSLEPEIGPPSRSIGSALKEAERLVSDVRRFAQEVHGMTNEQIDEARREF